MCGRNGDLKAKKLDESARTDSGHFSLGVANLIAREDGGTVRKNEQERLASRKAYEQKQAAKKVENYFVIDNNTAAVWCVPLKDSNFAAMAYKTATGGYELKWRWRYYVDNELGEKSNDTKNWCTMRGPSKDKDELIDAGRFIARTVVTEAGKAGEETHYDEILMGEDGLEAFCANLLALDDVHEVKAGQKVNCSNGYAGTQ